MPDLALCKANPTLLAELHSTRKSSLLLPVVGISVRMYEV
jgi:hypothetical protein